MLGPSTVGQNGLVLLEVDCSGNVARFPTHTHTRPINTNLENHHLYLGLFQGRTVRILSLINR